MRQVAILKAEVEKLRIQVKELEEDNKQWKEMAGTDAVTGLSSKVVLIRLVLPKVLNGLEDTGPYFCMVVSLDQFAHINQAYGWKVGDRMLEERARKLATLTEDGSEMEPCASICADSNTGQSHMAQDHFQTSWHLQEPQCNDYQPRQI